MAILQDKTILFTGDKLDAQTVNDISETAVEAYKEAKAAKECAENINNAIIQALNSEVWNVKKW